MVRDRKIRFWDILAFIGVGNWLAWALVSIWLGGDAFGGKIQDGKYFVTSHGHYTQVSSGEFTFSRIHGYTAFAGLGIAVLAGAAGYETKKRNNSGTPTA